MTQAKSGPPASRLATPADPAPAEVRAVTGAVNPLIADALVLYLKTKSYHWHLSGPRFRDYHLVFDAGKPIEVDLITIDAYKAGSYPVWRREKKVSVSTCPTASCRQPVQASEEVRT